MINYKREYAVLKFTELKNEIADGKVQSVYLLEGEDVFFKKRVVELIKNKFVTEPTLNYATFEGNSFAMGELTASLFAYPFMSEKRLTVLNEHNFSKDELKGELKEFLDNPPSSSVFIINDALKGAELLKKYPSVTVVDCSKADSGIIVRWIKAECGNASVKIEAETAKNICDYCLADMTRIENETKKLISYVGEGGTITKADVDGLVTRDTEYKIYEMTDYIGRRKFDQAIAIINDMLSKGETPQRLIISVYNYFRRLLHVAISNKTPVELANFLGIKEFAVKKAKEQARMFMTRDLKRAVDMLVDADYKIKNGSIDQNSSLWLSVFKIMIGE